MNAWGWTFLLSNVVYWAIFFRKVLTGPRHRLAVVIGAVHMILATAVSVAPVRSFFDANYPGFALGLLRFEGRAATLPSAVMLACALASAWVVISRSSRRALMLVALFDFVFAMNVAAGTIVSGDYRIQFGGALTIDGFLGLFLMLVVFAGAPLLSAGWAFRRRLNPL